MTSRRAKFLVVVVEVTPSLAYLENLSHKLGYNYSELSREVRRMEKENMIRTYRKGHRKFIASVDDLALAEAKQLIKDEAAEEKPEKGEGG